MTSKAYIEAQEKVNLGSIRCVKNEIRWMNYIRIVRLWTKISIATALKSSKFSSDRAVKEYAEEIWYIIVMVYYSKQLIGRSSHSRQRGQNLQMVPFAMFIVSLTRQKESR